MLKALYWHKSEMKYDVSIPTLEQVRYLGLHLDRTHKRIDLNRKYGLMRRLLGKKSILTVDNKLM